MKFTSPLLMVVSAVVLAGCAATPPTPLPDPRGTAITILHTNDHHGRFWRNAEGEYGMAARKTVVDAIRAEVAAAGGYSLLLDGGDVNTGVPESDLQDAVPDFHGMNLLGYDAMAVGNHEFDKPPPVLAMQRKLATFPLLSANIYRDGQRAFDPYKLFNLGGVRVAVMGLTTEDTRKMGNPEYMRGLDFRSPIAEAAQLVPTLRQQADVVIATTHMGHYTDAKHGQLAPGDVEMARAVPGLDLVVGGHSQNPVCMVAENARNDAYVPGGPCQPDRQNGAWIVQAHEWGKYVGRADFVYRQGRFNLVKYTLIPINLKQPASANGQRATYGAPIAENPQMLALLAPYQAFGQERLLATVGQSDARLEGDRAIVRKQATNLGQLIGQSMIAQTGADFAVLNAGGIRDSLPEGTITYKDILKTLPFGGALATVHLSGREVMDYLQAALRMQAGSGSFAHLRGIQPVLSGDRLLQARIGSDFVQPERMYKMVISHFVGVGGDGYPVLSNHPGYVNTGYVDGEALRAFVSAHSPIRASEFAPPPAMAAQPVQ